MDWLLAHKAQIGYIQLRPMATQHYYEQPLASAFDYHPFQKVISPDCSEMVTMICRMAGFQDPNGLGYNGYGYTHTLLGHLPAADAHQVLSGAIVVWESSTAQHAAMVKIADQSNGNPSLFSHGDKNGPIEVSYNAMNAYFGFRGKCLKVASL
jgi:hypothetical protein